MSIVNTLSLESNRQIKINFDGGDLSSDAGLLLIKEFVSKLGIDKLFSHSFKTNDSASFRYHTDKENLLQMDCTEAYKEHIMYSFNGFCKVVIRYAAINAWRDSYTEVTIPGFSGKRRYSEAEKNRIRHNPKKPMKISRSCGL